MAGKAGRFFRLGLQAIGGLSLLGLVLAAGLLLTAGWWLRVADEPREADAIVILAGDLRRAVHAADLYHQGWAPLVYVSRPHHDPPQSLCELGLPCPRQEDQMQEVLRRKGVPDRAVRVYGRDVLSTVEEAEALRTELGPGKKRLLVVTSAYHCRRAKMILAGAMKHQEFLMSATPYERFDVKWWEHQGSAGAVVSEAAKFLFYFLGTPFRSRPAAAQ